MTIRKTLTFAALALIFAGGASALEQSRADTQAAQPTPLTSALEGAFRLAQTATCISDGKRYKKGARLCMRGVYHYCNSRGLWEPSNQKC